MLAMTHEQNSTSLRKKAQFQVDDRVMTNNCRLGTVVRVDKDEFGEYIVVRLDILPGEFAYDYCDLEKL
ncbi:hypothetical protein [Desulfitobacterium sp.]|uniref:hypothetical protein n=1 Tax=Desulfitobacterium sp. TaxID=49981 RepID=UPI002CB6E9B3|nr:hypothetical protein [Desulfitobacterium sp.]HVJ50342.1 hypothetical protein [Desulfitobacterium sp.]